MQYDGNLVLSAYHFSDPGYWYTGTLTTNVSLVFNNYTASMYLVNSTGNNIYTLTGNVSTPVEDYYYRATINDHGNFQQLAYHKSNSSGWTRLWRAIDEPCVNAICGVNGMCFSQNNETSTCRCIPGYIPLDPNHVSKGCRPETVVNYCADPSMKNFTIEVIDDADFPFESFADLARVKDVDLEGCKKALMDDCDSLAASLVDSRCIKKRMPLLNARKSFSTKGRQALVKVPMKSSPEHKKKNDFDVRVFLRISVIVTATLAFCFGVSSIYYHPAPRSFIRRRRYSNANSIGINFQEFKYMELQKATNGFSKALGRGSSAKVYNPNRVEEESEEEDLVLSDWVISCMAAGKLETVVGHDPEVLSDFERFERMALVGLWCIHPDAMFRPSMKKVTQMLEGTLEIGIPPSLSDQMSVSNYQ
ncbi:G-TYPE LECTIN S-RECEPTOR-LIKE SERINE/THREONINE-PROTEIN KINASE SD2-5 [Salix koriyanagi]|uniref:G-TYPE LECTIN S-RECEPTOR-LIKE SERINE/THREONINE-PROTEIN KINASE SD2-5 n=1 Tax=Salix koriyanagi TaxID=2511006 RepID=A0A9Q1A449_9ROSI|nr:G-TYPE LECTIN S-RECEPTOR-LIKE SERINE/THREONINE-PROTEIN KINASE SD2-5 [Salix koriyanagi]